MSVSPLPLLGLQRGHRAWTRRTALGGMTPRAASPDERPARSVRLRRKDSQALELKESRHHGHCTSQSCLFQKKKKSPILVQINCAYASLKTHGNHDSRPQDRNNRCRRRSIPMGKPLYDPIPDHRHRLVDSVGQCFLLGAAGVPVYQFVKGLRSAPSGGRLVAGAKAVRANTPRVVGSFAAVSAVFFAAESAASLARGGKEDPWNSIAAASSGLRNLHRGPFCAARAGLVSASLVAVAAGVFCTAFAWADRRSTPCRRTAMTPVAAAQPQADSRRSHHWHWRAAVDKDVPSAI
jgi:mitochondrial import inner membrane translocase subunit TIM17